MVQNLRAISKELRNLSRHNNTRVFLPNDYPDMDDFNCWGFTAALFGWEDSLEWLEERVIENYLDSFTEVVDGALRAGDIAVFRDDLGSITHTATVIDPKNMLMVHKPGMDPLEMATIGEVLETDSDYGDCAEFRRVLS